MGIVIAGLVIAVLIVVLVKRNGNECNTGSYPDRPVGQETAMEILNRRLAEGKVDQQEYEEIKSKII